MLADPKWNHGTLLGLTHWLQNQPRDGEYNYAMPHDCLICRYMGNHDVGNWNSEIRAIYSGTDPHLIARGPHPRSSTTPQTYGQALERAYKALESVAA